MSQRARHVFLALGFFGPGLISCGGGGSDATSSASTGGGGSSSTGSASTTSAAFASGSASVSTTGATSSASTGTGGGDADWQSVPWWSAPCSFLYAANPANAFPPLEWTSCTGGEAGCSRLVKNWDPFVNTGQGLSGARRRGEGHELSIFAIVGAGDSEAIVVGADGVTTAAYRTPQVGECGVTELRLVEDGHWVGAQRIVEAGNTATYAYRPDSGSIEAAVVASLSHDSQRQAGGNDLFAIEWFAATKIEIFDRTSGVTFSTQSKTGGSVAQPRANANSIFFTRYDTVDDPTVWVWERSTGAFNELLGGGENLVVEARGDEATLVWIESPPLEDGAYPPGTIFTSPFTTDPKQIVRTPRWSNVRVSGGGAASAMGGGYYVVGDDDLNIRILRLADGRRWTLPTPRDDFSSGIRSMPYIDDKYIFLSTETEIFRIDMTVIGPGDPAE